MGNYNTEQCVCFAWQHHFNTVGQCVANAMGDVD